MLPARSRRRVERKLELGDVDKSSRPIDQPDAVRRTLDRIAYRYKPGREATDISHGEARKILSALGVENSLYDRAHRGNILDAVKNTAAKQAVALPSRFVRFGALGAFEALSPSARLAGVTGSEAARGRELQAKMLTYAGQHLRGGAHFVLNALANPMDLSSHARSLAPDTFAKEGSIASCILGKLHQAQAQVEERLRGDQTLAPGELQKIKAQLARCAASLQPEVERFVQAQAFADVDGRRVDDLLLRSATELVDTSGKIIVASLMDAAVPGLSRTGLQQLWSLASYPLMEGVIRAMHNWRDTKVIARVALNDYIKAKDHLARVSDERLDEIARHVQAHFEPASVANYGRRLTHVFAPRLLELRTRLAGMELEQAANLEKSRARSLKEFKLIRRRIKLQNRSLADESRIRLAAADYSASMELVELLTHFLRASPALRREDIEALIDFNIESLIDVHTAPALQARVVFQRLSDALEEAVAVDSGAQLLLLRFDRFIAGRRDELALVPGVDRHELPSAPQRPFVSAYTDSGRQKKQALAQLDWLAKNLHLRKGITQREAEVAALSEQIKALSATPPREGLLDMLELSDKQDALARAVERGRQAIDLLAARVSQYADDVEKYKSRRFDEISMDGEVREALATGSTGAAAAMRRTLQYGFAQTLQKRRSLGIAMAVAYDPTASGLGAKGVFEDKLANGLAEGFLNASMPVPAVAIPLGAAFIQAPAAALVYTPRRVAEAEAAPGESAGAARSDGTQALKPSPAT